MRGDYCDSISRYLAPALRGVCSSSVATAFRARFARRVAFFIVLLRLLEAEALIVFAWNFSTRLAVSTSFCLPV